MKPFLIPIVQRFRRNPTPNQPPKVVYFPAKPDARIYRETLRRGGSAPGEAVHVGNSLINDVQGARAAGLYAVWLNCQNIANDTTIQFDAVISNLHQLPDLIGWDAYRQKPGFDRRHECPPSAIKRPLWTRGLYACN